MDFIGAGLGDQLRIRARSSSAFGAAVGGNRSKLFNRVERHAQHRSERGAPVLVVHVDAVQRHRVRAELVVNTLVLAFAEQVKIEVGNRVVGQIQWRLHITGFTAHMRSAYSRMLRSLEK